MTVISDEFDRGRLGSPRIVRHPLIFPVGIKENLEIVNPQIHQIIFAPEYNTDVNFPDDCVKIWDVPWRWYCQDCYAACGWHKHIFKTDWEKREDLEGRGNRDTGGWNEPSSKQRDQITAHARQHEIMYSWAKGLK